LMQFTDRWRVNMDYHDIIVSNPAILNGKPVIKDTRIPVELILKKLSEGMTTDDVIVAYPHLTREAVLACLAYTADVLSSEEIIAS
jgi:uncharacterized protein (DUF433 family)